MYGPSCSSLDFHFAGAKAVALAVAGKRFLWKLNLRENELEDQGAVIVSRALLKVSYVIAAACHMLWEAPRLASLHQSAPHEILLLFPCICCLEHPYKKSGLQMDQIHCMVSISRKQRESMCRGEAGGCCEECLGVEKEKQKLSRRCNTSYIN